MAEPKFELCEPSEQVLNPYVKVTIAGVNWVKMEKN